jgi:hypothetical protein
MNIEVVPHSGWNRNVRLANGSVELIITLDVGPRILSYRTHMGENVFKTFDDQLGKSGEAEWMIRGGHRFWIAPEDEKLSYHIDNERTEFRVADNEIVIDSVQTAVHPIRKSLGVSLLGETSGVKVTHTATNESPGQIEIAPWALSVMRPGGIEIIPQPALGEHPRDLLPNRGMVLWPYTDLSDPRWHLGRSFFTLRQSAGFPPTKIGLAHREKWVAYVIEESIFIKAFEHIEGLVYPDGGCSFETFTNDEMLEIESLGPLVRLAPGRSVSLTEHWHVFPIPGKVEIASEDALGAWIQPFLKESGL